MLQHRCSFLLLALLLLTACGSQKKVIEPPLDGPTMTLTFNADRHMKSLMDNRLSVENVTAKVRVRVAMGDRSISTTGTLRMRRNDVIQISLVDPLVGIAEVGRMEFTPTNVLIIDRFNKQYIDVPYAEVSFLQRANVDFNTLQSLFLALANQFRHDHAPARPRAGQNNAEYCPCCHARIIPHKNVL